jgi:hypothetical protein
MPRRKTEFEIGMATVLNNKDASFLKHPEVFNTIQSESKMPLTKLMRHLGRTKKELTDKEKSEQRLNALKAKIEETDTQKKN